MQSKYVVLAVLLAVSGVACGPLVEQDSSSAAAPESMSVAQSAITYGCNVVPNTLSCTSYWVKSWERLPGSSIVVLRERQYYDCGVTLLNPCTAQDCADMVKNYAASQGWTNGNEVFIPSTHRCTAKFRTGNVR